MGSCVVKSGDKSKGGVVITKPSRAEESKKFGKKSNSLSRKTLKQKAAVVDNRLKNDGTAETLSSKLIKKRKTDHDIKLIKNSLKKHFIFSSLTQTQIDSVVESINLYEIEAEKIIFEQNSKGSFFFIISSGRVEVIINSNRISVLKSGDSFGELALLHDTPRTATIKTLVNSTFWCIDRNTFRRTLEQLNASNYSENRTFIDSIPVFEVLSDAQKDLLVSSLSLHKYSNGSKIISEGDSGDLLFIIKEGNVVCTQQGKEIRKMTKGDYFGEQALFYGSPRTATVIATDEVACLALGREDLSACLGANLMLIIYKNTMRISFAKNSYMNKLVQSQLEKLINEMEIQSYMPNETIIEAGTLKSQEIYVIVKGTVTERNGKQYKLLDILGEKEVINNSNETYEADIIATEEVDIARISSSGFFNSIGGDYSHVTSINEKINSLKRVQLFKGLNNDQLFQLVKAMKTQEFSDGQPIVEQNSQGDSFYLIKSGKVEILKDGQSLRTITKNDYFGERSLLFDERRSATAIAKKKVSCLVMSKSDFINILNEKMRELLMDRIRLQENNIALSDLIIVKTLGSGMFGNVFLVIHKSNQNLYALKTVDRRKINAYQIEENIALERKILLELDHVLIMKLVRTYKDDKRLYFLMEYIRGMDLFDVIRKLQLLKECDARFYISCIFNIIEHLHERDIIFRDLKPENMVVDAIGYPRLIDFGTARFLKSRTYTIVGTPHYMAPEIVTGDGYGLAVDYWTVGVMLYEFMFGYVPFGEDETDPYVIYEKIHERKLVFPQWVDNKNKIKEFISQLLSKNPANRLGGGFDKLKTHPWFIGLNWDKITSKELKAPYIPVLTDLTSEIKKSFNSTKTIDEIVSKLESSEHVPDTKRTIDPPPNWDDEF
jgi:cGMP-dependent protein kinase 1